MGGFLVVTNRGQGREVDAVYAAGLKAAGALKGVSPVAEFSSDFSRAAVFPRERGASPLLPQHKDTGSWLLAIGMWFHSDGYATGSEQLLLEQYLKSGIETVANLLEGFFTIVIGDGRSRDLWVVTDIAGSCHSFARNLLGGLVLSSSSLVAAATKPTDLDPVGCQEFLYTGNIYEDRTLWKDVRKLPPASAIRIRNGEIVEQRRYWRLQDLNPATLAGDAAVEAYWNSLTGAAKKITRQFSNPACDLTGGFDSRVLAAGLLGAGANFSAVVSGNDGDPDVEISRALACIAGVPHLQKRPEWAVGWNGVHEALKFTDGECNLFEYAHVLRVHRDLAQRFDISLNGSFGEIARGAWWDLLGGNTGEQKPVDPALIARSRFVPPLRFPLFPSHEEIDLQEHFTSVVRRTNEGLEHHPNTTQVDNAYLYIRMQRWQGRIASSTSQIWPCLSPFLFRSVMESVLCTDWRTRRGDSLFRRVLDRYSPKLGNYPLDRGTPAVPLGFTNLYRFAGVGGYYWKRLRNRWRRRHGGGANAEVQQRLAMWKADEVRSLLDPARMQLSKFLDTQNLSRFLKMSAGPGFVYEREWGRLVTLESTCRAMELVWTTATARQSSV